MPSVRIELTTFCLQDRRNTTMLRRLERLLGFEPRTSRLEGGRTSNCAIVAYLGTSVPSINYEIMEGTPLEGLEPSTLGLKVRCSNQLSYSGKPTTVAGNYSGVIFLYRELNPVLSGESRVS